MLNSNKCHHNLSEPFYSFLKLFNLQCCKTEKAANVLVIYEAKITTYWLITVLF